MKYILSVILLLCSTLAVAEREPLPDAEEPHFVAVVACNSVKLFLYYDAENLLVIRPGQINSKEDMVALLDLKEAAQDAGNAKVVRVTNQEDCTRT